MRILEGGGSGRADIGYFVSEAIASRVIRVIQRTSHYYREGAVSHDTWLSDRLLPFSLLFLSYSALRNASQGRLWYVAQTTRSRGTP